jgi:hypothetical protein
MSCRFYWLSCGIFSWAAGRRASAEPGQGEWSCRPGVDDLQTARRERSGVAGGDERYSVSERLGIDPIDDAA